MLGKNIKRLRKKMNISQEALAQKSGLTWSSIVKFETEKNKNPKLDTLIKLSNALNVGIDELVK